MKPTRFPRMVTTVHLALLAAPVASQAQQTSKATTIVGSLANFDVVNDNPEDMDGFEIQLESVDVADITRVFGQSGAACYIRYCIGSVSSYPAVGATPRGVIIRWAANYNAVAGTFTTPANTPLTGSGRGTPPRLVGAAGVVTGESCWSLGLGGSYPLSGCEHFGVSLAAGKNSSNTIYRWLKGDPTTGTLAPPATPPVAISQPVVSVIPPVANAPAEVQAAILAPAPIDPPRAALPHRYGKA